MRRPLVAPSRSGLLRPALAAALVLLPAGAGAYDNDIAAWKLGSPDPLSQAVPPLEADLLAQERFARFTGELALAVAPLPGGPAHSLGDAGFELTFSGDIAFVHPRQTFAGKDANGNAGVVDGVWPLERYSDKLENAPASAQLFVPTLHFRKGLPFSLEAGASFSYVSFSRMAGATGSVKWAVVEGFQWWPSLAVRGFATVLLGSGPMTIVVSGWDVGGDYRIPIVGGAEITLYGGFQMLGLSATTKNIDFDPKNESDQDPTTDDTVFQELVLGSPLTPTTAYTRPYFGLRFRWRSLVAGADAAVASGSNVVGKGLSLRVQTKVWKAAANIGVVF